MFLLDTNILIEYHKYNPPNVFVTQWQWFEKNALGVCSIDEVFNELSPSNTVLHNWAKKVRANGYFLNSKSQQVQTAYKTVSQHVMAHYDESSSRDKFLNGADGWLVAMGMVNGHEIITFERKVAPNSQKVKIPNVANQFNVKWSNFPDFCYNHRVKF